MGNLVLKCAPGVDLYVEWSTVVENITFIGDRVSTLAYLAEKDDNQRRPDSSPVPGNTPQDRLRRADEHGTSAMFGNPPRYGWADDGFIVDQRGVLRRADLLTFAEALEADDKHRAYGLLQPFEDDDDPCDDRSCRFAPDSQGGDRR